MLIELMYLEKSVPWNRILFKMFLALNGVYRQFLWENFNQFF